MGVIDIDFAVARKQAQKLDELADDLERLKDGDYNQTMEQIRTNWTGPWGSQNEYPYIRTNWTGESANAYLTKGAALETEIEDTIREIRKVAGDIRETVRKLEEAQEAAQAVISGKNF